LIYVGAAATALVGGREGADCSGDLRAGMSVSLVARQHGIAPNQVFTWRRLYAESALSAVGAGAEASEYGLAAPGAQAATAARQENP